MIEAVLFDMDGVITETGTVHAAAWRRLFDEYLARRAEASGQRFRRFEEREYRELVDGRPRYDGVQAFLESRGISLPYGTEQDDPDADTVCGLGNRKNRYFHEWLDHHAVKPFAGAIRLVDNLRRAGVRCAVFSASRNAAAVLRSAGVVERFDVIFTGADAAELKLPGKPDPAMLLETAARLDVLPARTAVIEDSTAGVQAAVRGGFALVIGVDREGNGEALRRSGAHAVVRQLDDVRWVPDRGLIVATRKAPTPSPGT